MKADYRYFPTQWVLVQFLSHQLTVWALVSAFPRVCVRCWSQFGSTDTTGSLFSLTIDTVGNELSPFMGAQRKMGWFGDCSLGCEMHHLLLR